jgi:hypothetical protein
MLKVFSTHDITEEYVACRRWPLKAGWSIKGWLPEAQWAGGIPMPDFATSFNLKKHHISLTLRFSSSTSFCIVTIVPFVQRSMPTLWRFG